MIVAVDSHLSRGPRPCQSEISSIKAQFATVISLEGLSEDEKEAKELAELNKRKLHADLSLVEKTLKSYPFTKWSARIALGISIVLAVIEIVKLFKKSS